jgi:hypothetical protein
MSDDDGAEYAFFSVLRRGLSALIQPGTPAGDPRVAVPVTLSTGGSSVTGPALALYGPGDVAGFDAGTVRRTWPAAGAGSAEPNYFPLAELSDADLPWRYSPDAAAGDRLTPWLCLIVLADGEIGGQTAATAGHPLATVTVTSGTGLPDLTQAWAWAHAQVFGGPDAPANDYDPAAVAAILAQAPSRASARLLCPRQLSPQTSYQAFLVPTFERGRLAGLGQPVTGVDRLAPAWQPQQEPVTLPVYYSWSFQTGPAGDFASLVAQLHPVGQIPDAVWQRGLAVSPPGADPANWQVVDLASTLMPVGATIAAWPGLDQDGFTTALAARTNTTGTQLAPPLYGRWLAAAGALLTTADATPPWFHQLNADPRARVAAGLGTVLVQSEQQQLLAGAWAQVAGIRAANERLRLSQLARELALRLYTRHLTALDPQSLIQVSSPLHGRVRVGAATVAAQFAASPIVPGALAPAWRRAARPLGTLGVRQGRPAGAPPPTAPGALARLNSGALSVVPAPGAPPAGATGAAIRLGDLAGVFTKVSVTPDKLATVTRPPGFAVLTWDTLAKAAPASDAPGAPSPADLPDPVDQAKPVNPVGPGNPVDPVKPVDPVGPVDPIKPVNPVGPAQPVDPVDPGKLLLPVLTPPVNRLPDAAAEPFVAAAGVLMTQLAQAPGAGTTWTAADLDGVTTAIKTTLHPVATIEKPLAGRLTGVDAGPRRTDPLEPVMAAPVFPQPMYAPLTALGREWLLPGLDQMTPADAIGLFTTNWPFVESFLVGLNHELARKLLWNGYPTDQRGTYFRRFWDIRGPADPSGGDIGPIHQWTAPLGQNRQLTTDPLVLLVRGELIRRYPNVVVYAVPAEAAAGGRHTLDPDPKDEIDPIFFALIEPDIALFGFDIKPADARADPGYFFVLQEHPSEPRFGLEPVPPSGAAFGAQPDSWQALAWNNLAASAAGLAALNYIDLTAALPLSPVHPDGSGAAWQMNGTPPSRAADLADITFRQSQRLAVHGSVLIPAPPAPPAPPTPTPATPPPGAGGST